MEEEEFQAAIKRLNELYPAEGWRQKLFEEFGPQIINNAVSLDFIALSPFSDNECADDILQTISEMIVLLLLENIHTPFTDTKVSDLPNTPKLIEAQNELVERLNFRLIPILNIFMSRCLDCINQLVERDLPNIISESIQ